MLLSVCTVLLGVQVIVSAEEDAVALAIDPVKAESLAANPGTAAVSGGSATESVRAYLVITVNLYAPSP